MVTTHLTNIGVHLKCSTHLDVSKNNTPSVLSILLFQCHHNNRHGSLTAPLGSLPKFHQMKKKTTKKLLQPLLILL